MPVELVQPIEGAQQTLGFLPVRPPGLCQAHRRRRGDAQGPPELRPGALTDLVTARFEDIFDHPDWDVELPVPEDLRTWLLQQPRLQATQWEAT